MTVIDIFFYAGHLKGVMCVLIVCYGAIHAMSAYIYLWHRFVKSPSARVVYWAPYLYTRDALRGCNTFSQQWQWTGQLIPTIPLPSQG